MAERRPATVLHAEEIRRRRETFSHPWNDRSEIQGFHMSREAGLERTGISYAEIPPGKESFIYHAHYCEEEWIYILKGRAVLEVDGREHNLESGDFAAFPTPSVAHHLRNPFDETLEYLMGGESRDVEIADFPHLNRRLIRRGREVEVYDIDAAEPFFRK